MFISLWLKHIVGSEIGHLKHLNMLIVISHYNNTGQQGDTALQHLENISSFHSLNILFQNKVQMYMSCQLKNLHVDFLHFTNDPSEPLSSIHITFSGALHSAPTDMFMPTTTFLLVYCWRNWCNCAIEIRNNHIKHKHVLFRIHLLVWF